MDVETCGKMEYVGLDLISGILMDKIRLKEVNIETFCVEENQFACILCTSARDVILHNESNRLSVEKENFGFRVFSLPMKQIRDMSVEKLSENELHISFLYFNIKYKMSLLTD